MSLSDILSLKALKAIKSLPSTYTGIVASRSRIHEVNTAVTGPFMNRLTHYAYDNISNPQIIFPNWYADEKTTGGTITTLKMSIEYPAGVFTQATFNGSNSTSVADGANATTDPIPVSIPFGASFWTRTYVVRSDGNWIWSSNMGQLTGDACEWGTGATDKTISGTVGSGGAANNSTTNAKFTPLAIIAPTRRPTIAVLGDSRTVGLSAMNLDMSGNKGEISPTLGQTFACMHLGVIGEQLYTFMSNRTKRTPLTNYCSHVVCNYGINDVRNLQTATSVQTNLSYLGNTVFAGKPFYVCTLPPNTNSTDSWVTTTNQTTFSYESVRVAINNAIRNGTVTGYRAFFELADVCESNRDSGLWKPNFTADGLHENTLAGLTIVSSGAIKPSFFTRG